jgi:hypothetical protein
MEGQVVAKLLVMAAMVSLLCSCGASSDPKTALRAVWAVEDGEKVYRDDTKSALKKGEHNSVWDGKQVKLFAARNEVVAFQVILEAGSGGAKDVDVRVSDLANGKSKIRGSHPLPKPNEYEGVGVELFTEHYLHVETPSYNDPYEGGFDWTANANPKLTGWMPDALIPFSAKPGKGGAPFDIGKDLNQGVWVDIYVPKELPAGVYQGTVSVTVSGKEAAELPVSLEVLGLALPDENHYKSMVFYSDSNIAQRHGLRDESARWEMIRKYHQMAHRHRLELIGSGSWEELEALKGTLDGSAFSRKTGYAGPGEGVGNSLFSVNTYSCRFPDNEEGYRQESDRWVEWFTQHAPKVEYFLYLTDEPEEDRFPWVKERASWIHNNPGPGGKLPVFLTKQPLRDLEGAVDIWCSPTASIRKKPYQNALARGERVWLYAAYRPRSPGDVIDEYGIAFRLKPWIAHQHGITRWFTWESTHWTPNHNEVRRRMNLFQDPVVFTSGPPSTTGNGDGTLFYPGQDQLFPREDRGYPGPLSSVRMKMYRRGAQDVEYMWLAEQAGHAAEVQALLKERLPATLWEAGPTPSWSNHNADYERARRRLAELIAGK